MKNNNSRTVESSTQRNVGSITAIETGAAISRLQRKILHIPARAEPAFTMARILPRQELALISANPSGKYSLLRK
jgi:hypothetical protein